MNEAKVRSVLEYETVVYADVDGDDESYVDSDDEDASDTDDEDN